MVVSKMIAVRKTITFLKHQLENKNLKHSLEWLAHEQLCHEAFAPREQLDLTFKFEISRCSEKHKIGTFKLQHWFETDSLKKCFTKGVDQLKDDCYYRCCKGQAVIDALLYTNRKIRGLTSANGKKIFLIQATVSERHSVKPKPLKKIVDHLAKLLDPNLQENATVEQKKAALQNAKWFFIFFVATQDWTSTQFQHKVKVPLTETTSEFNNKPNKRIKEVKESQQQKNMRNQSEEGPTFDIDTYQVRWDQYQDFMNDFPVTLVPDSTIDVDNASEGDSNGKDEGSRKPGNKGEEDEMDVTPDQ